jgi:hypothetical protein
MPVPVQGQHLNNMQPFVCYFFFIFTFMVMRWRSWKIIIFVKTVRRGGLRHLSRSWSQENCMIYVFILLLAYRVFGSYRAVCYVDDHIDGVRLTSQNRGHKRAYCSSPRWYVSVENHGDNDAGENSWLVYQGSLVILPAETSGSE